MSSDEQFSDLTDLDELSEEEYGSKPSKRKAAKGKGKGKVKTSSGGYRIRHALKAPRATTYSTEALYKQIHNGDIDLEPEYQREVVWPEAKQIGIIDSIFRNFYIPPVIFAVKAYDDGTEMRTCIDGKQRLTSIHRFVEGLIPHKDPLTGEKLWYRDNPDHRTRVAKRILPEKYRNMFDGKAVVCVEYQDLKDADEREIFQRVQLGVALTPAEKLKVLTTPRARFVRALQDSFLDSESAGLGGSALAWDRSRGSDFRCLAQTIQCIALSPKTTSIQATEKWLADPSPLAPTFAKSIQGTYRVFERLVEEYPGTFVKIAPVEFISVGILVHRHKDRLTLDGLKDAVAALRANARKTHDDIRNNGKVYKTMSSFIDTYHGPAVGRHESSAADTVGDGGGSVGGGSVASASGGAGTKRKAAAPASDQDSDDDYAPARRAAPRKRERASPVKPPPPPAPAPPTPPLSAPPSNSPPAGTSGIEVMRAARERIAALRANVALSAQPAPPPSATPFTPQGGAYPPAPTPGQGQPYAYGQQQPYPYSMVQGQAQHGAGAAGVAAALEANLMGAASGWGAMANGTRVKTEPVSAPPFSAGSAGSGGGYRDERWPRGGGGSGSRGDYDYDRDRGRERDYDYDYDRSDKRYHDRDGRGGRGGGGGGGGGRRY